MGFHSGNPPRPQAWLLAVFLLGIVLGGESVKGQGTLPVAVDTVSDGNGLFSFTFRRGQPDRVWAVPSDPSADNLFFPVHGAQQVFVPAEWRGSISNGVVSIGYNGSQSLAFLDGVTFSVRSSSTVSMLYDGTTLQPGGRGLASGTLHSYPDNQSLGGGYTTFSFIGPAPVPEPSVWALLLAGGALLVGRRRRLNSEFRM